MADYGCRGPNEWEMRVDTWETKPALALAAIDRMRLSPDADDPSVAIAARAAEREAVRDEIAAILAGDPGTQACSSPRAGRPWCSTAAASAQDERGPPHPRGCPAALDDARPRLARDG